MFLLSHLHNYHLAALLGRLLGLPQRELGISWGVTLVYGLVYDKYNKYNLFNKYILTWSISFILN